VAHRVALAAVAGVLEQADAWMLGLELGGYGGGGIQGAVVDYQDLPSGQPRAAR